MRWLNTQQAANLAQAAALQEEKRAIQAELAVVRERMAEAQAQNDRDAVALKEQGMELRRLQEEHEFEEACIDAALNPTLALERRMMKKKKAAAPAEPASPFDADFAAACEEAKRNTEAIRAEYEAGARRDAAALGELRREVRELQAALAAEREGKEAAASEVSQMRDGYQNMKEENELFCQEAKAKAQEVEALKEEATEKTRQHQHVVDNLLGKVDRLQQELREVTRQLDAYKGREDSLVTRLRHLEDRLLPKPAQLSSQRPPEEAVGDGARPSPGKVDFCHARQRRASRPEVLPQALGPSSVLNQVPDATGDEQNEMALAEEAMTRLSSITEKLAGSINARLEAHRAGGDGGR